MPPRSKQQFKELRDEKKSLIMDAALFHFANFGYKTTTIEHLARHAGISKGLMYNYFSSKKDLLSAIIDKSVKELYSYFDRDKDGYLTEEEFEFFIRQAARVLNEKRDLWRLLFQVLMQNEARIEFLNAFTGSENLMMAAWNSSNESFVSNIMKQLSDYFIRKKEKRDADYDPFLEMNMFIITLKGFALTYIYMGKDMDNYFSRMIDKIISAYK